MNADDASTLILVEKMLADRIGLDPVSVGDRVVLTGLQARMKRLNVARIQDYARLLRESPEELQELVEEVVIPESWFFRDDRPFETFREVVREQWIDHPEKGRLQVLCLPCAGGEEPYSLAICLLDLGLPAERFRIEAADVSERSVRRAVEGVYRASAFRGAAVSFRDRYFLPDRGSFRLDDRVRRLVKFHVGNVLDPLFLEGHSGFDVVFCRNMLIYFDPPARQKAFVNLGRLTAPGGLLFLGHADRPDGAADTPFVPHQSRGSFAYRKSPAPQGKSTPPPMPSMGGVKPQKSRREVVPEVAPAAKPAPASAPTPAAAQARPFSVPSSQLPSPSHEERLEKAAFLADKARYLEALREIDEAIRIRANNPAAHFLAGMIHQGAKQFAEAEAEFAKAVYLDPNHDEALLSLALLAHRRGDIRAEAIYRRRFDRILARKGSQP